MVVDVDISPASSASYQGRIVDCYVIINKRIGKVSSILSISIFHLQDKVDFILFPKSGPPVVGLLQVFISINFIRRAHKEAMNELKLSICLKTKEGKALFHMGKHQSKQSFMYPTIHSRTPPISSFNLYFLLEPQHGYITRTQLPPPPHTNSLRNYNDIVLPRYKTSFLGTQQ